MILSDQDLRLRLARGELIVTPLDDPEVQIQPASIDLRLGDTFVSYRLPHIPCVDPHDPGTVDQYTETITIAPGDAFILQPGEFALEQRLSAFVFPPIWSRASRGVVALAVLPSSFTPRQVLLIRGLRDKSPWN